MLHRREVLTAAIGVGTLLAAEAAAQEKGKEKKPAPAGHAGHGPDAKPAPPPSPALQAIIDSTARCLKDGRVCLARCTDHLAAGTPMMADCQRAVMNMLAVTEAMASTAGYASADPANLKALARACAAFCRACEKACEPHAKDHVECKACGDACRECAKACETYAGR
ncbi:MAG: Csp1 family four helix bundle copper storage protein [Deltaproteobacteria bacterium]|nr:Csp1 family four helix bundle copper storage protein [Deltaproteobacteria bacterium]